MSFTCDSIPKGDNLFHIWRMYVQQVVVVKFFVETTDPTRTLRQIERIYYFLNEKI